jgi:hypothetical protein
MVGVAVWLQIIDAEYVITAVKPANPAFLDEPYLFGHGLLYTIFAGFTRYIKGEEKQGTRMIRVPCFYGDSLKLPRVIRIRGDFIAQSVIHAR